MCLQSCKMIHETLLVIVFTGPIVFYNLHFITLQPHSTPGLNMGLKMKSDVDIHRYIVFVKQYQDPENTF